jgi:dimethylargininase
MLAITRDVARSIEKCELTFIERATIDFALASAQHRDYCRRLEALGLEIERLAADEAHPDCCFVEDTAVVLDEIAIVTSLGASSRRGETRAVEAELKKHRPVAHISLPATLEGGDVLVVGKRIFVGRTKRTNDLGIEALRRIVAAHGYDVAAVRVPGCLHLKSAVTALDDETLLANRAFIDPADMGDKGSLGAFRIVNVDPEEPGAANVLRLPREIWGHAGYPRTLERVQRAGHRVVPIDISEFVKAEAALTCKCLLLRRR